MSTRVRQRTGKRGRGDDEPAASFDDEALDLGQLHAELAQALCVCSYEDKDGFELRDRSFYVYEDTTKSSADEPEVQLDDPNIIFLRPKQYALLQRTHVVVLMHWWTHYPHHIQLDNLDGDHFTTTVTITNPKFGTKDSDCIELILTMRVSYSSEFYTGSNRCLVGKTLPIPKTRDAATLCTKDTAISCVQCHMPIVCTKCALLEPKPANMCKVCAAKTDTCK